MFLCFVGSYASSGSHGDSLTIESQRVKIGLLGQEKDQLNKELDQLDTMMVNMQADLDAADDKNNR